MPSTTPKKPQKLTPKEKLILKNYNPELSNLQNLKPLIDTGQIDMGYAYKRLKKSELLTKKIDAIHAHWDEMITRELVPQAISNIKRRLKGKRVRLDDYGKPKKGDNGEVEIEQIDTFRDDKLVIDTYVKRNEQPQQVHNTYIEQIQAMFGGGVETKNERVVTVDLRAEDKQGGG